LPDTNKALAAGDAAHVIFDDDSAIKSFTEATEEVVHVDSREQSNLS
jgi:hypothetical protein